MNTPTGTALRVLIIDDAPSIQADFQKILDPPALPESSLQSAQAALFGAENSTTTRRRFAVDCASQGQAGLTCVEQAHQTGRPYALAFVDMRMPPGWDGIETIRRIWAVDPDIQIVICTAYSDHTWEDTVRALGDSDSLLILKKPFDNIEVLQLAHALTRKWLVTRATRERLAGLDEDVRQRTAELTISESRFAKVFRATPVPTTLQDAEDGRYVDINPAFAALSGRTREEVIGRAPAELGLWPAGDIWTETLRSIDSGSPLRAHHTQLRQRNGDLREVLVTIEHADLGTQLCVLSSVEDVTERSALEQQFRQSQKMEAVGQLAAGIAHDFNNLLTVVQTYTDVVLEDDTLNASHRAGLVQVQAAAARAAALTRQLLVFSRRQITQPVPLDIAATLSNVRQMLERLLPENIVLAWECADALPRAIADEANLEQIVMNLVVNARDAMPQGGTLRLSLRNATFDAATVKGRPDARPGRFVWLSVKDDGSGIPPDVINRIFEPFFTTKPVGKGTGLGLSTVYAIVRQHQGWIEVTSPPACGTTFDIFLPALDESRAPFAPPSPPPASAGLTRGRGERVLLVEDEAAVRKVTRRVLSGAGYNVIEAGDGPTALALWNAAPRRFDLLVTDMVMPNGITGAELAVQLRERQPGLKVLFTTGYSQELLHSTASGVADARVVLKPFACSALLNVIRELLDTPSAPSTDRASAA